MTHPPRDGLRALVLAVDAVLVLAAMGAAYGAHSLLRELTAAVRVVPELSHYAAVAYLALPLWLIIVVLTGADRLSDRSWSRLSILGAVLRVHVFGALALFTALFLTQSVVNRSLVGAFLASSFLLMLGERVLVSAWLNRHRASGQGVKRLLVVADAGAALAQLTESARRVELAPLLVGRLGAPGEGAEIPHLGEASEIESVLAREAVDEVVFLAPYHQPRAMEKALLACDELGIPASFAVELEPVGEAKPEVAYALGRTFITFERSRKSARALAIKHSADVILAVIGIVLLLPLFLLVSIAILITMGRPVFFTQKRAGRRGREFSMLKFRTMVKDAEAQKAALADKNEMSGPVFKIGDDPRVTKLGRFLRKSSIDELPQLFNVASGAMSLVGPRPLPVDEQRAIVGWHRRRLSMKPGITCIWQIRGRSDVDFEGWMAYDLEYIDSWSLGLDMMILLSTIPVVLRGRGAK